MSTNSTSRIFGAWSQSVDQLSGRLCVEFEDLKPGLRHAVYLELRNDGLAPSVVSNLPEVRAELYDSSGQAVGTSAAVDDGPTPILQWAVIPRDSYLGLRVDRQSAGVPTKEHKRILIALGDKTWELSAGKYLLEAIAVFKREESGPDNQWVGELKLPSVDVVVTGEVFIE
jgi:hypothetical protein